MKQTWTGSEHSQSTSRFKPPRHLLGRLFLLAGLLAADGLILASIPHTASLLGVIAPFGIVSYAVFIGLGYSWFKRQKQILPFRTGFYAIHLVCVLAVVFTNFEALHGFRFLLFSHGAHLLMRAVLLIAITFLALACIPLNTWIGVIRETKQLWLYSVLAGALAWTMRFPFQSFWDESSTAPGRALQFAAFHAVKIVLRVFLPDIQVDPATFIIGTPRFAIIVAEACSGLEGLGLVLVFTTIWLWYFRKESRFPQALLLIPCALVCVWLLNIARICALVLIGNAGYGEIAMVGFHSQAGWIAFTTVAFTFSMLTRKLTWVRKIQYEMPTQTANGVDIPAVEEESGESPATPAYLVPFLAILAASFVSKAASGHFEWLYPLRFVAAAVALWLYRREFKQLDWRIRWLAPLTGAAVFALWVLPSLWIQSNEPSSLGEALTALSPTARWSWIVFRIAAAGITIPIAEELAFRGYLARRIVNRDFDQVPFSRLTLLSIALSSAAFGLMHGHQWFVGVLAGLAYAGLTKWKGRLSDAIAAHATTNLLLAIWVLSRGDWSQW
jgi:exosortase E/protease (VPEID-CTERM system)